MNSIRQSKSWRLAVILFLGFTSGLPLALTGTAIQAWLTVENLDIATIGFFSLVGLPYTFKFLWAPLMDRFEPPFFGRRRGWLLLTQLALAAALILISTISPKEATQSFALVALLIAFLSASQDVVIDAYRTDILESSERGIGSSLGVFGYRMAMILSGGIALVWADANAGYSWSWSKIYSIMSIIMLVSAGISFLLLPPVSKNNTAPDTNAKNDLLGFLAVVFAVFIGYQITTKVFDPFSSRALSPFFPELAGGPNPNKKKWADLISLLLGMGFTLPAVWFAAQKAKFETFNRSLKNYFTINGAAAFLLFIVLYKLGDAFAGSLTTAFLLKGVGFAQAEIGVVNKVIGIWLTILGAILGGTIMVKLGLFKSLFLFGILQLLSNFGFYFVSILGKGAWGSFDLPAFDFLIISLKETSNVDWLLLFAVGFENITGGMGTAAFVAFLMALCNQKFTATQYALLSAFAAIGRVWVGPLSGVLSESIGWPSFFIFSAIMALPGLLMLWKLKDIIISLETPVGLNLADD